MSRANPPVTPEVIEENIAEISNRRASHFEMTYGQYDDQAIEAANAAHRGGGRRMGDLNRIFSICQGMAAVMRIAAGNDTVADFHDPDDADSEPPLSRAAINSLTTMCAAVCEWIADDISLAADVFKDQGAQA